VRLTATIATVHPPEGTGTRSGEKRSATPAATASADQAAAHAPAKSQPPAHGVSVEEQWQTGEERSGHGDHHCHRGPGVRAVQVPWKEESVDERQDGHGPEAARQERHLRQPAHEPEDEHRDGADGARTREDEHRDERQRRLLPHRVAGGAEREDRQRGGGRRDERHPPAQQEESHGLGLSTADARV